MRVFLGFCLYLAAALIAGALLAYPASLGLSGLTEVSPHRLLQRIALLLALLCLPWFLKWLGAWNRQTLGFGIPRGIFLKKMLQGVVLGALILLPALIALILLEVRVAEPPGSDNWSELPAAALAAAYSGIAVALIEESFFRGAVYGAIALRSGPVTAIVLSSLLYAALHFMSGEPQPASGWTLGLAALVDSLTPYTHPASIADSLIALFFVGIVLALMRQVSGSIALCIGAHAAWVFLIKIAKKTTDEDPNAAWAFLVGNYDGIIGWLAAGWLAALVAAFWLYTLTRQGAIIRRRSSSAR